MIYDPNEKRWEKSPFDHKLPYYHYESSGPIVAYPATEQVIFRSTMWTLVPPPHLPHFRQTLPDISKHSHTLHHVPFFYIILYPCEY